MPAVEDALRYCLERGLTFVAFRSADTVQLWVQREAGLKKYQLPAFSNEEDRFIVAPFATGSKEVFVLCPHLRVELGKEPFPQERAQECVGEAPRHISNVTVESREEHAAMIGKAQDLMRSGILRKVVLSRSIPHPFPSDSLPKLFTSALTAYPKAFVCLLNCPEQGTWLGASPERLLHWQGGQVTVDSIAGTLPAERAPLDARDWGEKERDEQELVSLALDDALAIHSAGPVERSATQVIAAGPVAHLHTIFKAPVKQVDLWALTRALHPTPAVCGTPRDKAMEFILENEPQDRKLYAGYWGPWRSEGAVDLYVNIRCMEMKDGMVRIRVGGGITAGSIPEKEWQELEHKASTWTKLMEAQQGPIS